MLFSTFTVAIAAFASAVSAQANFTSCCNVTPTTVDLPTRLSWCRAQQNTCPEICANGQTSKNDCDPNALTYTCTCLTGATGNISDYAQTLPSLECDAWKGQCTAAHPNDLAGQTFCQSFICGSKNASSLVTSSTSSAASGTPSSTSGTGTTTGATASATASKAAAAVVKVAQEFGTAGVAFGLFAVFGLAL